MATLIIAVTPPNVWAQSSGPVPSAGVPLSSLVGLDLKTVRSRLADVPASWPFAPGFAFAKPDGITTFIQLDELMTDPSLRAQMQASATAGHALADPPKLICNEALTREGVAEDGSAVVLMFWRGHLAAAFTPGAELSPSLPMPADFKPIFGRPRPFTSVFLAHPGELPLEDGMGFLSRVSPIPLKLEDQLRVACKPPPPPTPPPTFSPAGRPRRSLSASDFQELALLPFAVTLPGTNRHRVAARKEGAATLAQLKLGTSLDVRPQAFAASHPGARFYPAKIPDYGVLTIDIGGVASNSLNAQDDTVLVGVRDRRVEWIAPPSRFGPSAWLMCLDDRGVPSTPRRGCWGFGNFSP